MPSAGKGHRPSHTVTARHTQLHTINVHSTQGIKCRAAGVRRQVSQSQVTHSISQRVISQWPVIGAHSVTFHRATAGRHRLSMRPHKFISHIHRQATLGGQGQGTSQAGQSQTVPGGAQRSQGPNAHPAVHAHIRAGKSTQHAHQGTHHSQAHQQSIHHAHSSFTFHTHSHAHSQMHTHSHMHTQKHTSRAPGPHTGTVSHHRCPRSILQKIHTGKGRSHTHHTHMHITHITHTHIHTTHTTFTITHSQAHSCSQSIQCTNNHTHGHGISNTQSSTNSHQTQTHHFQDTKSHHSSASQQCFMQHLSFTHQMGPNVPCIISQAHHTCTLHTAIHTPPIHVQTHIS